MHISVSGIFKEISTEGKDSSPLRSFNRVFIIVPAGSGFCIANEQLYVTNCTPKQIKVWLNEYSLLSLFICSLFILFCFVISSVHLKPPNCRPHRRLLSSQIWMPRFQVLRVKHHMQIIMFRLWTRQGIKCSRLSHCKRAWISPGPGSEHSSFLFTYNSYLLLKFLFFLFSGV